MVSCGKTLLTKTEEAWTWPQAAVYQELKWSGSVVSDSAIPWTVVHQALLSMGFSKQEYWSGLPFLSPKESWALKNWCFWTVVWRRLLRVPCTARRSNQGNPKGNQSWIFIGRTDAEAETPILWPPDANWLIGKYPDAGKDWRQKEKETTADEMVGWHYQLNGHGFRWTLGVGDGQGGLACCSSWGHRVGHDWATELNLNQWKQDQLSLCGE